MGKTSSKLQKPIKRKNSYFDMSVLGIAFLCFAYYAQNFTPRTFMHFNILSAMVIPAIAVLKLYVFVRETLLWRQTHASFTDLTLKCIKMTHWRSFFTVECFHLGFIAYRILSDTSETQNLWQETLTLKEALLYCMYNYFLLMYLQWHESPITESYRLEQSYSFSGGSSMALGFFYGYLRLIIRGKEGLLSKINDFQDRNGIPARKIPFKKLFILIPSSTYILDQLRKTDLLEPLEKRLDAHKQDRGLVENRSYKNMLYKLKNKSNTDVECYIPLEGATPLKTYWETCTGESRFKEYKREIISSFYYTLDHVINENRETRGFVELVYYDDEKNEQLDEELRELDEDLLTKVVRKRIKHLKAKEAKG